MSDRPERPGPAKRRQGEQVTKDDMDDDDNEGPAHDPGSWRPVDNEAIKARRKVHVRRAGAADASTPAAAEAGEGATAAAAATASSNPFAGINLAPPASASANPFAGISLVPPAAAVPAPQTNGETPAEAGTQPMTDAEPAALATENGQPPSEGAVTAAAGNTPAADDQQQEGGGAGSGSTVATSISFGSSVAPSPGNPFASLGGATKPFGGFAAAQGGGFGALANTGTTFGAAGGAAATSAFGTFGASGFNFGAGAFPAVPAKPLGSTGGADEGGDGDEEGGEGEGGGEGMALFGNAAVQPVVTLPEQEKRTGEEEEESLFTADGALYEFDSSANKWRERGKGEFKVNASTAQGSGRTARMVMRQAANLRLLMNAKVYSGMPLQLMAANVGVTFGVINAAGPAQPAEGSKEGGAAPEASGNAGIPKPTTYAVKIKSTDKVLALHHLLNELKSAPTAGAAETAAADDKV